MLERDIEQALCKRVKLIGGMCEKFTSPSRRAVPDRIITLPNGQIVFVECKRPGCKPTAQQELDHARRRAMGCRVIVIDSLEGIEDAFPV